MRQETRARLLVAVCALQVVTAGVVVRVASSDITTPIAAVARAVAQPAAGAPLRASRTAACRPAPLADRVGRVLVVGLPGVTSAAQPMVAEISRLGVGGVLLNATNVESADQVRTLVRDIRAGARGPITVTIDEEPGRVSALATVVGNSPSARRLANERTPGDVRSFARTLGAALADAGVDVDLAPVVDLDAGPSRGIIGDRSFSAEPAKTATYAMEFAAGLADSGITSTVKHFPGHGRSADDSHVGRATISASLDDIRSSDLRPFQSLIDDGIPVVMMNHLDYQALDPNLPASLSPRAYALLREMGFQGVAMTDSVLMGAVNQRWDVAEATVMAIKAGADGVLVTDGSMAKHMHRALMEAVAKGDLDENRLDEAAARMTALAGGDPDTFACHAVKLPRLRGFESTPRA